MRRFYSIGLALGVLLVYPAAITLAGNAGESCSCKNLESLQQELENAQYQAKYFAELSRQLKQFEDQLIKDKKDPTNPRSGDSLEVAADNEWKRLHAEQYRPPHPNVKDYTGPAAVDMPRGTCTQSAAALEALRAGSPCKEIADITLEHEAQHRAKCTKEGAAKYWARLPSQFTAEEAERYEAQATAMRKQLKRVIDEGTVTVEAEMEMRVFGPQFDVTYSYVTDPMEMQGKSSPGADDWTLKGDGHQAGTIKRAKIAGMNCKPSGQINDAVASTLNTDGLRFSLDESTTGQAGDVKLKCKGGFGMSMRPQGETGGGRLLDKQRLATEVSKDTDVSEMDFAKYIRQGGMSVAGSHKLKVQLVCPGQ